VRVCAFLVVAALWAPLEAQQQPSIDGAGGQDVRTKCLGCHQADLIAQQRMARDGWDREIAKMERWGVVLSAAVNQWTLLVGGLPIAYSLSAGSLAGLPLEAAA